MEQKTYYVLRTEKDPSDQWHAPEIGEWVIKNKDFAEKGKNKIKGVEIFEVEIGKIRKELQNIVMVDKIKFVETK